MAARPMVYRVKVARAITTIAKRRTKVADRHRDRLPDSEDSGPREVLDYLRKYSDPPIPLWVLQADVCDALTRNNWLWWEGRRRELHFVKAGRERRPFLSQVGVGKQGVIDRIDRLGALLRYDWPDENLSRAARQAARMSQAPRPAEIRWVEEHRCALIELAAAIAARAATLAPRTVSGLTNLPSMPTTKRCPQATMAVLGVAAADL